MWKGAVVAYNELHLYSHPSRFTCSYFAVSQIRAVAPRTEIKHFPAGRETSA
jgi:hypothetical protein